MAGPFVFESFNFLIQSRSRGDSQRTTNRAPETFYQHWPGTGSPVFGSSIRRRAGKLKSMFSTMIVIKIEHVEQSPGVLVK